MPFDASIPLQTRPVPQQDPLATVGALANLQNSRVENMLRMQQLATSQAQQANVQAEADQKQRDLADQNTIQQKMADPDFARSVSSWDGQSAFPLDGLVSPKAASDAKTQVQVQQKASLARTADQDADYTRRHAIVAQTLKGLMFNADGTHRADADIAADAPASIAELVKDGIIKNPPPTPITGFDDGQHYAVVNSYAAGLNDANVAAKEAAGKAALPAAQAAEATGKGNEAQASADLGNFKLNLMKGMNSGSVSSSVDNLIDPAKYPKANADAKAAATLAMTTGDPAKVTEAVQGVYNEQVGSVQKADALIPGEVSKAVQVAQGTIGTHEAEDNYRNALRQGDKASADYFSSLKDAKLAVATANTIQTVIDLSKQTGNPVAMQQLKAMVPEFTNAAQNIKRLSGGQNAGLSSSLDNAINEITSAGGKPLSDETIKAISPYVKTIANGAVAQHNANVQALSKAYPQKQFAPEPVPYGQVGSHFAGESVPLKSGKTVRITKILPNDQFEYE